jgi:hypothetical protein
MRGKGKREVWGNYLPEVLAGFLDRILTFLGSEFGQSSDLVLVVDFGLLDRCLLLGGSFSFSGGALRFGLVVHTFIAVIYDEGVVKAYFLGSLLSTLDSILLRLQVDLCLDRSFVLSIILSC